MPMNNPLELTAQVGDLGRPPIGRVLIVGARRDGKRLARCLSRGPWRRLPVVGFIDAAHGPFAAGPRFRRRLALHPAADPVPVLGSVDQLDRLVDESKATHVVVALSGRPAQRLRSQIAQLSDRDVAVHWIGEEVLHGTGGGLDLDLEPDPAGGVWNLPGERGLKRAVDIAVSTTALVLLSPLFAAVAALIRLTSAGPVFYTQERIGQGGRLFRMIKFRSMRIDAESVSGPIWAAEHDDRCTRIGDWLRSTNIDELPQLFNVLKGEMSLVGPRPLLLEYLPLYSKQQKRRHDVKPGITGWAQVNGRNAISWEQKFNYDIWYVDHVSFFFEDEINY